MPPRPPSTWCIALVTPRMEGKTAEFLTEKGVAAYRPVEKYKPIGVEGGRLHWKPRTRPLFPGYVFVSIPDDETLDLVNGFHAVRGVMSRDGGSGHAETVRINPIAIGSLVLMEACREFDATYRPPGTRRKNRGGKKPTMRESRWQHGQLVRVKDGPFASFMAQIVRTDRTARIGIMVTIFGRATPVEVGEDEVEAAA